MIEFSLSQFSIILTFALDFAFVLVFVSISIWFLIVDQKSLNQKNVENWYRQTSAQTSRSISNQFSYQFSYQQNSITYSKKLILLEKIYRDENKFDITNDNFDFKIMIFYDKCNRANLSQIAYEQNVSIMFRDQVLIYFYINRHIFDSFNDLCINIKNFFADLEWQRFNLAKWQIIIFSDIVEKNSSLDLFECFRKLITNLDTIQRDINSAYRDSMYLRKNIIRTCKSHSTLIHDLTNLSTNTSVLINMLHINIVNYEIIVKSFINQQQYVQNQDDDNEHLFVNRRFRRDVSSFNRQNNNNFRENFNFNFNNYRFRVQ